MPLGGCRAQAGHAQQGQVEKGRKEVGRLAEQLTGNLPAYQRANGAGRGRSQGGRPRGAPGARQTLGDDRGTSWTNLGRILDVGGMVKSQKDADGKGSGDPPEKLGGSVGGFYVRQS